MVQSPVAEGGTRGLPTQFRLGQMLYFVLWDDETDRAAVAGGEVVEYASDHSKVRVKVVESAHPALVGRSTWILPERLDDSPRAARANYQRRARESLREGATEPEQPPEEGKAAVDERERAWSDLTAQWADVDFFLETMDYEAGWAENEERLARYALLATLRLCPLIERLVAQLPDSPEKADVHAALQGAPLRAAIRVAGSDACALLERWSEVDDDLISAVPATLRQLRGSLAALGRTAKLQPELVTEV